MRFLVPSHQTRADGRSWSGVVEVQVPADRFDSNMYAGDLAGYPVRADGTFGALVWFHPLRAVALDDDARAVRAQLMLGSGSVT